KEVYQDEPNSWNVFLKQFFDRQEMNNQNDKNNTPNEEQQSEQPKYDEENKNEKDEAVEQEVNNNDLHPFEQEVVELTNQEREKQGLSALEIDKELSKVAKEKSRDMLANQYFAHDSPTYGSPFDMM